MQFFNFIFIKKKRVYTALSKFWNYNVYHFLYFSNDNKFFLNDFQSHNLAKKNKKKISFKKIINIYHRSEFLLKKKEKKKNKRNVNIYFFVNKNEEDDNDFVV